MQQMVRTILLAVAVCGETLAGDKRRRTPEPVSALQIRAESVVSAAKKNDDYHTIEGQCQNTADQRKNRAGFNPNPDWQCPGTDSGSFNATAAGLNTLANCAQFAKDTCGGKAAYVSFHPGDASSLLQPSAGDCAWFSSNKCSCFDTALTSGGKCQTSMLLNVPYQSGKVAEIFTPAEKAGNGVAKVATGTENGQIPGTETDPTIVWSDAQDVLADRVLPEAARLGMVPSATEIDMKLMHESPAKIFAEMKKVGAAEAMEIGGKPTCPDDKVAASRRGEWQCISGQASGKVTMYVLAVSFGTCALFFLGTHFVGRRIRKGKTIGDDEEEYGGEEEADEEEYAED